MPRGHYAQQYLTGTPASVLYVADGRQARFLGATQQIIGAPWLNAAPFHYCGNIAPADLTPDQIQYLTNLGSSLAQRCGLRGAFGVDAIVTSDQTYWPIEINPRYTASIEVLKRATNNHILDRHAQVFRRGPGALDALPASPRRQYFAKAILFADEDLAFPGHGPWRDGPDFADIPALGNPSRKASRF